MIRRYIYISYCLSITIYNLHEKIHILRGRLLLVFSKSFRNILKDKVIKIECLVIITLIIKRNYLHSTNEGEWHRADGPQIRSDRRSASKTRLGCVWVPFRSQVQFNWIIYVESRGELGLKRIQALALTSWTQYNMFKHNSIQKKLWNMNWA